MAPPKLPADAFKQPNDSPWDVQSSARKPKPLALPQWAGRYPVAHPDHSQQLDMDAAVNEFGLKMPREQAEDEAYRQYLYHPQRGQHAEAAYHHLRGMKAAHAAGDMESARKHSLMFNLHSKALGKSPHDAARELQSHIKEVPEMHKFKAHRGDAFAVNQPPPQEGTGVVSSTPPPQLNKREQEVLHMLYLMSMATLEKHLEPGTECDEAPLQKAGPIRTVPMEQLHGKRVYAYRNLHNGLFSLWHKGRVIAHVPDVHLTDAKLLVREAGRQKVLNEKRKNVHAFVVGTVHHSPPPTEGAVPVTYNPYMHAPTQPGSFVRASDKSPIKNAAHVHLSLQTTPEGKQRASMMAVEHAPVEKGEVVGRIGNPAGAKPQPKGKSSQHIGVAEHKHHYNPGSEDSKGKTCTKCKQHFAYCYDCDDLMDSKKTPEASESAHKHNFDKGELSPKGKHCKCTAYHFPHRHGGGKCKESK